MEKVRQNGFDWFKGCACIAVILIHYYFPNNIGIGIRTISRFAVPVFFMVSGYFMLSGEENVCDRARTIKKIKHIILILFTSAIFYFFFDIIRNLITHWGGKSFYEYIRTTITGWAVLKFFITNDPFRYAHLWFLMALAYCYIFMLLFDKIYPRKLVNCFPVLLLLFLVFGLWGNRMHIQTSLYDKIYFKNLFILRALPFFLAGMWLRKNYDTVKAWTISEKSLIIAIFFGSLLSLGERKFFVESQFYLRTYIVAGAMMIYAMKYNQRFHENSLLTYAGRELSMYVYIIHIAVGHTVNIVAMKIGIDMQKFLYVNMFFVLILSVLISQGIVYIKNNYVKMRGKR